MTADRLSLIRYYEKLPVAVYICDQDDALVEYNSAAAALFGVAPDIRSKDWYPSLTKYDLDGCQIDDVYKSITAAIRTNANGHRQEIRLSLPNGTDRYVLISSVAIWDEFENYDGAIHTLSDLTALRYSESKQSLLASIVNSSEDSIITKNLDGRITSWNRGAELLFGYSAAEAIGQYITLIIPQERLAEEKRIIKAINEGKKVEHFETIRRTKAGEDIPISLTVSPVRDNRGMIVGASKIARDITRQKRAEKELKSYTTQLEDMVTQRTSELTQALNTEKELGLLKSRFVSMASHEFRTPLSAIKLSASLIEKYALPYEDQQIVKHIGKIKNSVNDLAAILGDFLSLEKLESGKINVSPTEFDITEFCREVVMEMQLLSRQGQELLYNHSGTTNLAVLDQQLLKNCLHNLLSNAIKYSGEGTLITLTTELNDDKCLLSVSDHGIGIPEADQPHMFGAFFRAENTGTIQGTGLGLNIVARYTSLMNGTIDFKSELGRGTTFTLCLPQPERR